MKINFSHVLGVAVFMSILSGSYVLWNTSSTSDTTEQNTSTLSDRTVSKSDTGIETDTGKRIETFGNSGTNWGMNPFGSGKPLEEEKKPEFKKPNTEWKTRTLSGITYVFGEGNPKEVGLPESEMKGCSWQEGGDYCTDNGDGYVDPLLEKLVYDLLNSPDWQPLLQNCEKDFRIVDSYNQKTASIQRKENPGMFFPPLISYETILNLGQYISMEEIFTVNPKTGRKNITKEGYQKLMGIYSYIQSSSDRFNNGGLGDPLPGITKCVDTYGIGIANLLVNIRWMPWRGSKDTPTSQGGWDGKLVPLEQSF